MAGMGKTGTVNITPEMMDEAIKAIQAYRQQHQKRWYGMPEWP